MLSDLEPTVLRHRFIIYLNDISLIEQTRADLCNIKGIDQVSAHLEIAKGFMTLKNVATAISIILIAILFVVSMFIISNTIKLTTFERREEIAIMKMVGATSGFIRGPFIIEGLTLGLMGSLTAFIAQWALYELVATKVIANAGLSFIKVLSFASFEIPLLIAFLVVGLFVGLIGSSLAIKNYLRV